MARKTLSQQALNRATLARQMLLERKSITPLKAIEKLCGMQSQMPRPPYIGLWTRLSSFEPEQLKKLMAQKKVVRATMMRGTIHLMTAADFLEFRPSMQEPFTRGMKSLLGKKLAAVDLKQLLAAGRKAFQSRPQNFKDLVGELQPQFPKLDVSTIRYPIRVSVPLVQVPSDDNWGFPTSPLFALAESWLGTKLDMKLDARASLFRRYLASFGPASMADFRTWSGLKDCDVVTESSFGKLSEFEDDKGRVLYDLPRAPRPKEDVEAPVRLLSDYDNLLLAYADRRRIVDDEYKARLCTKNLRILPAFLVKGRIAGIWDLKLSGKKAALEAQCFYKIAKSDQAAFKKEAEALIAFVAPVSTTRIVKIS